MRLRHRGTHQGELGSSESLVDQAALLEHLDDPAQGLKLRSITDPKSSLDEEVNQGFAGARVAVDLISSAGTAAIASSLRPAR